MPVLSYCRRNALCVRDEDDLDLVDRPFCRHGVVTGDREGGGPHPMTVPWSRGGASVVRLRALAGLLKAGHVGSDTARAGRSPWICRSRGLSRSGTSEPRVGQPRSTTDVTWSAMARWKRRRMSWMPSASPRAMSSPSAYTFALVGPRPYSLCLGGPGAAGTPPAETWHAGYGRHAPLPGQALNPGHRGDASRARLATGGSG